MSRAQALPVVVFVAVISALNIVARLPLGDIGGYLNVGSLAFFSFYAARVGGGAAR
jgi:hypothetical protein